MFLNVQLDLLILKPDNEQFTLTIKKNHCISPLNVLIKFVDLVWCVI